MKNNLIIGAGQLGSRHLQGILRLEENQNIFVYDPSSESLKTAESRASEILHNYQVQYVSQWDLLPSHFDLVIIATAANVRSQVINQLVSSRSVDNLILEKVLFQEIESYEKIGEILKRHHIKTWVNHPRRLQPHYQKIQNEINTSGEVLMFDLVGTNWGLACNGLHFVDLVSFLSGSEISSLDMDWVDSEILNSKRENYIEFSGTVKGSLRNGGKFIITSMLGDVADLTITIATKSNRWIIDEVSQKIIRFMKDHKYCNTEEDFETEFQSVLTTTTAQEIFATGSCNLPTYKEACNSHLPFVAAALDKYNSIYNLNETKCPIT